MTTESNTDIWRHGWTNVGEMLYMHGGSKTILTSDATEFAANNYPIVAFASCYGTHGGTSQEDAALTTARNLRAVNPNVKNIFYWKADLEAQISPCSKAGRIWKQHPEWRLKDATAGGQGKTYFFDTQNPAFRSFWRDHILSLAYEMDEDNEKPIFDGFFIDGMPTKIPRHIPIDAESQQGWWDGCQKMVKETQIELDYLKQNQLIIINGLNHQQGTSIHSEASPASMVDHFGILQFIDKNTGQWKKEQMKDLLFNVIRSPVNLNRTLIIKAWPGPVIKQKYIWPNDSQPKTLEGRRQAAKDMLHSALALFLLVAETNMYFCYSWFWDVGDYIPFGTNHNCPEDFYPEFQYPLGAPLGPPKESESGEEYEYTREYEHASVFVDLKDRNATKVVWHGGDSGQCPSTPALS